MNDDVLDVDFDDEDDDIVDNGQQQQQQQQNDEPDLTTQVLQRLGISDPSKINFEDENGQLITRDWNDLTTEEQVNILTDQTEEGTELDEQEIGLINQIRQSQMSVNDFMNAITQSTEIIQPQPTEIDNLSDDEIYILDVLNKLGDDVSDEDLDAALESAKQNPALFDATVKSVRDHYKQLQEQEQQDLAIQQQQAQQESYNRFSNDIISVIRDFNTVGDQEIEMTNDDKDELAHFILDLDQNGQSNFGKAMSNPVLYTKAAFWLLNGDKIVEELSRMIGKPQAKPTSTLITKGNKPVLTTPNQDFVDDEDW